MTHAAPSQEERHAAELHGFRVVLGALNELPFEPGDFEKALVEAMMRADSTNLWKLRCAFPEIGLAVWLYKYADGGLDYMKEELR